MTPPQGPTPPVGVKRRCSRAFRRGAGDYQFILKREEADEREDMKER